MKLSVYVTLFFEILIVVLAIAEMIAIGSGLVHGLYGI